MSEEIKGRISVETENIFPIIKKWLYSEKDIFIRELVSNSSDAITKLKKFPSPKNSKGETIIESISNSIRKKEFSRSKTTESE